MVARKPNPVVALPTAPSRHPAKPTNRLAAIKRSDAWEHLPRVVQRDYEANENRLGALVDVIGRHGDAIADTRADNLDGILASAREWQSFIDELGDAIGDDERQALLVAKSNELAGLLTAHQGALDTLNGLLAAQLLDMQTRPAHTWTRRTGEDYLEDFCTFGEAELERRGYAPLSFGESLVNTVTFGAVADARLREHERARLHAGSTMQTAIGEEGGIIDASFSPR